MAISSGQEVGREWKVKFIRVDDKSTVGAECAGDCAWGRLWHTAAARTGPRFNWEESDKAKPLLSIGGYTVLDHWMRELRGSPQIGPIVIVTNEYFRHQYEAWLEQYLQRCPSDRELVHLLCDGTTSNETRKGAVHAMHLAHQEGIKLFAEKGSSMQGACVIAGDTLLRFKSVFPHQDHFDVAQFMREWAASSPSVDALTAYRLQEDQETLKRGILEVDSEMRVQGFLEKPDPTQTASRLACPPVYLFREETMSQLGPFLQEMAEAPLAQRDPPGTFLQWMIEQRQQRQELHSKPFMVTLIGGRFDIGNIEQYAQAHAVFGLTDLAMESPNPTPVGIGYGQARIGLIGNPSDGYHGKTLSCTIDNFGSEVIVRQDSTRKGIRFHEVSEYGGLEALSVQCDTEGYSGGLALLKSATKRFFDLCVAAGCSQLGEEQWKRLQERSFDMHFRTTIPFQVGLAGSSAIVCAVVRALACFYQIPLASLSSQESWPQQILDVESQLGIAAGLQDRVIQYYGGLVSMDFSKEIMEAQGHGQYHPLPLSLLARLQPLYLVYIQSKTSSSGKVHSDLRKRWLAGDEDVLQAMKQFASITDQFVALLQEETLTKESRESLCDLLDANFNLRLQLLGEAVVGSHNVKMVETVRSCGLACKFTGSGGAVICMPRTACTLTPAQLEETLCAQEYGFAVVRFNFDS